MVKTLTLKNVIPPYYMKFSPHLTFANFVIVKNHKIKVQKISVVNVTLRKITGK